MATIFQINSDLDSLWTTTFSPEANVYAPLPYIAPKPGAIIFVGMNPSFSLQGWQWVLQRAARPDINPQEFFAWPRPNGFNEQLAHQLEALAREHYPFFAPHRALAAALEIPCEHIDLFAYRETNQKVVKSLVVANESEVTLTKFGECQFKLFEEVLALAKPKAVVVINALASRIYRNQRKPVFDINVGHYWNKTDKEEQYPVFFSGILTGARALDRFSKDRLFWHVAKALGKTWQPEA